MVIHGNSHANQISRRDFQHITHFLGAAPCEEILLRRARLEDADWHVTARGARRLQLFHDEEDFKRFYLMLGEACRTTSMGLLTDCLMSNHFHLGLSGSSTSLTQCMQRLNRAYSGYHNDRYRLSGHAFEQAYYCTAIPSEFILKRVIRYIHLNPVRSGQVTLAENYPWSSYRRMIEAPEKSLSDGDRRILSLFDDHIIKAQDQYRSFVEKDLYRRIAKPIGRTPAWELWQEQFRWILEFAIQNELRLQPLEPEVVAVHFGSRIGIPPRAMGSVLNHPNGRQVSEMIRALNRRLERTPRLRPLLDALHIL